MYTAADFYLELSLHEGFGMQMAEAMSCGTVSICGGGSALSEIGGGFELPTDVRNAEAIAHTIIQAYQNGQHQTDTSRQIEHTRQFNWNMSGALIEEALLREAPA